MKLGKTESFGATDDRSDPPLTLCTPDRTSAALLYQQVAAEIRRAIAAGEAKPGEKIPQARDLAEELGVNVNTVLRALRQLRDEGLLEMGRGRSIRVSGTPERSAVVEKVHELVELARCYGYPTDQLLAMVRALAGG